MCSIFGILDIKTDATALRKSAPGDVQATASPRA